MVSFICFNIKHKTVFSYNSAPLSAIQKLRITPIDNGNQKILNWNIDVIGCSIELETNDFQGNKIHLCKTVNDSKQIEITSYGKLEIFDTNGITGPHKGNVPIDLFKFSSSYYTNVGSKIKKLASDLLKDIDGKNFSDIELLLDEVVRAGGPFSFHAKEIMALSLIKEGRVIEAQGIFKDISEDASAPPVLARRAEIFLR